MIHRDDARRDRALGLPAAAAPPSKTRTTRRLRRWLSRGGPAGTLAQRERPATSLVLGLRYLTEANTTYIVDYFRNGAGYAPGEMETYFEFIDAGTSPGPSVATSAC